MAEHQSEASTDLPRSPDKMFKHRETGALSTLDSLVTRIRDLWKQSCSSERRQALWADLKSFVQANPRLSAFMALNMALTGVPLATLVIFSLTITICSIVSGMMVALLGAFSFICFCVVIACAIAAPILIFTTGTACFVFILGLAAFEIIQRTVTREQTGSSRFSENRGTAVGVSTNGQRIDHLLPPYARSSPGDVKGFANGQDLSHEVSIKKSAASGAAHR